MPPGGLALPPRGDLSYWGSQSLPTPRHFRRTLSQGVPMAVAQNSKARAPTPADTRSPISARSRNFPPIATMLTIRRFEEKAGQMYGMGLIGGFCHLYIGQEAVVVGMQMALKAGRPGHHRLSRPRPHARLRHGPERRDGGTHRPQPRLFQGQGRLDAHVQRREGFLRRPRHRRRAGAARHRARLRQPLSRQRQCLR